MPVALQVTFTTKKRMMWWSVLSQEKELMTDQRRILELALLGLHAERDRLEREILELNKKLGRGGAASRDISRMAIADGPQGGRGRRRMSEAQKKKISQAMKARWAARRRGKTALKS
jgi:hypothetical protein